MKILFSTMGRFGAPCCMAEGRRFVLRLLSVNGSQSYAPYGEVFGASGAMSSPFAFTGEPLDGNGLQYHRARYMNPALGGFLSLDPWEGTHDRAMSLNGLWVLQNVYQQVLLQQ